MISRQLPLCFLALSVFASAAVDPQSLEADARFFTDPSCSALKPGVALADLASFKSETLGGVAKGLLAGTYDKTYRAASYAAYPTARELAGTLKLGSGFSSYENITGMYLDKGENVVFVGPTHGKEISLLLPDWMRKPAGAGEADDTRTWGLERQVVELKEGANIFTAERAGNAYVSYFDDHAEDAMPITVHFATGRVNGYFDTARNNDQDWNRLLENAVGPVMDARGKHVQVAYPVEWLKHYAKDRGVELIRNYDTILNHHYTLCGLVKYNKVPKNRILARVNFHYYMFRDRDGVAYMGDRNVMGMVADPGNVVKGDPCWGFSHEVGHVLQIEPQITWPGMSEVSVNLFSLYTTGKLGNPCRLAAQKSYASARKNIIDAKPRISYLKADDVFDRLVPFWQLHLYFTKNGVPDFYADVMERMRGRPDAGEGGKAIMNQFQFIEICCDVAKADLTGFFDKWGFFFVGEIKGDDYGAFHYVVTQAMVDEVKARIAAKGYPKPATDITEVGS